MHRGRLCVIGAALLTHKISHAIINISRGELPQSPTITARQADMRTITTIEDLTKTIESGVMYVRWSDGPDADAENGWISRNWAEQYTYNEDGEIDGIINGYDEIGLSVTAITDIENPMREITRWRQDVHGTTCYLLTATEVGDCSDGEPLVADVTPIAYVDVAAIEERSNAR